MAPAINDIIRVIAKMSYASNDIQNVWHIKLTSGTAPAGSTLASDIADLMDDIYGNISPNVANNVSFDTIRVDNLTQDETYGELAWPTLTSGGSGTESMLPPQTAALVLFDTATPNSLGKKFLPPVTANVLDDDGTPTSSLLGAMGALITDVLAGLAGGTYSGEFGNWRDVAAFFAPYATGIARDFFATQRRRYYGKGT